MMSVPERLAIDGGTPVRTQPFPDRQPFGLDDAAQLLDVLRQQTAFFPMEDKVFAFQRKSCEVYGVRYAVASTSGTAAIHVAIGAIDPDPGDEIITTSISDMGTVAPIIQQNCIPVFADVEPGTFNLDPVDVARKITDRTRAIIVVHCWGQPAKIDEFMEIAQKHNLYIIEDCSQAHLTKCRGRYVGTIGHLGTFSLQHSKHLQCGDGGLTITNDPGLGERAKLFVDKGCWWSEGREFRQDYLFFSPCYRMTEFQGAVLLSQIERLPETVGRRQQLGDRLADLIEKGRGIHPPDHPQDVEHSYWSFPLRVVEAELGASPQQFADALAAEGVPTGTWLGKPLYLFRALMEQITYGKSHCPFDCPVAGRKIKYSPGLCPNAEQSMAELREIHINEHYTPADIEDIAAAVNKVSAHFASGQYLLHQESATWAR